MAATKFRVTVDEPQKHRHLSGILKMIHAAELPEPVKDERARRVFRVLAEAEAAVHGVSIEKVHFHEVGAVDSICDIVGACLALHLLKSTPVLLADQRRQRYREYGTWRAAGSRPGNRAAAARPPIYSRGPAMELTTPTGAAFVTALAEGFGAMPPMRVKVDRLRRGRSRFPGARERGAGHGR